MRKEVDLREIVDYAAHAFVFRLAQEKGELGILIQKEQLSNEYQKMYDRLYDAISEISREEFGLK